MSYLVLALKWRPQRFADVVGQGPVSRTLSNALKTGRAAQAYLFSGPRGVGKTTMARILAKALNCERAPADEPCNECRPCREITAGAAMDVIEIDGASNRGIDDIRELRESAQYAPASLARKVYIIDEVHMLTQDAFNALLKTLEEPPRHVVFILATTEPLKVPATILSRCQRFDFARLGAADAFARLRQICDAEQIAAEDEALHLIARKGEGSMRDALTLLDQVVATGLVPLTAAGVRGALGITGYELFFEWTAAIQERDAARVLRSLGRAVEGGASLQELAEEFLKHLRNLLVVATDPSLTELLEATDEERAAYLRQAAGFSAADLLRFCRLGLETAGLMRRSAFPRVHLEVALAEMCALPTALDLRRFIEVTRGRFPDLPSLPAGAPAPRASATPSSPAPAVPPSSGAPPRPAPGAPSSSAPGMPAPAAGRKSSPADAEPPVLSAGGSPAPGSAGAPSHASPGDDPGAGPWDRILTMVAGQKPALAAFLNGSMPAGQEGNILRIAVPGLQSFQREQLERKTNRQFLCDLIAKNFGRSLGVRFEATDAGAMPASGASRGERVGPAAAAAAMDGPAQGRGREADACVASPERIRRIADLFDGDVIGPA